MSPSPTRMAPMGGGCWWQSAWWGTLELAYFMELGASPRQARASQKGKGKVWGRVQ